MIYKTLFIYALVAADALGAADLDAAMARCSLIEDGAERLACYDGVAEREDSDASTALPTLETATIGAPPGGSETEPPPQDAQPVEAREGSERSVWRRWFKRDRPPAASQPMAEEASRGDARRDRSSAGGQSSAIAGEIVRLKELMRGNVQVTLDNGQVWQENEYEPNTTYAVGDQVTIEPDFMGTRVLRNQRTRQSVRVRRVR